MKINKTISLSLASVFAIGLIGGCSDPEYPAPVPANGASTVTAKVMVINASPDAPSLTTLVNNATAGQAMPYGSGSGYLDTQVGSILIAAGATTGSIGGVLGSAPVIYRAGATNQANFSFAKGLGYTFFVTDTLNRPKPATAGGTNPGGPQFLQIADGSVTAVPAAGKASVRFLNLAPGNGTYFLTLSGVAFSTVGRAYRATTVTAGGVTTNFASYTAVNAGGTTLEIRTGSTAGPIVASSPITLSDGKIYTVIATGIPGKAAPKNLKVTAIQYN